MGVFSTRKSTEQFVNDAISVHGDRYDYSEVEYKTNKDKVRIICSAHGAVLMSPNAHLSGRGCPTCGRICASNKTKRKQEEFIIKACKVHGLKYDYSKVEYINNQTKICIICSEHGEFWQAPSVHLSGCGCPKCKCNVYKKDIFGFGVKRHAEYER